MVIASPPCNTWSRATLNPSSGPRPLRSSTHLWGFPWLSGPRKSKLEDANALMRITLDALVLAADLNIPFILEHPEDLGRYHTGDTPASIWRLPEVFDLAIKADATRWALHQRSYGTPYAKPTGILASFRLDDNFGVIGWPVMREDGRLSAAAVSQDRPDDL